MRFKGFKPIKLIGEPSPTVGDGHQDSRASDRNAALKTQRSKTVGLFATFTRGAARPWVEANQRWDSPMPESD